MVVCSSIGRSLLITAVLFLCAAVFCVPVGAQGLTQASPTPGGPPPLPPLGAPANDCGCNNQGSDVVTLSSGMIAPYLPKIPNLELSYQYSFGKSVSSGRFTADYMIPFKLSPSSILFGEAHAEGWDFWKKPSRPLGIDVSNSRVDLSIGGGYRKLIDDKALIGVNGFFDATRITERWYKSGSFGVEMAAMGPANDVVDLNFNWYGSFFNRDFLANSFRTGPSNFDLEAGYSRSFFDCAFDLRLHAAGYRFDTSDAGDRWRGSSVGSPVYGWRAGADVGTGNGLFTLKYEYGYDGVNNGYNTIGAFLNVGFQIENLLRAESPFSLPEWASTCPRGLGRNLASKVNRQWGAAAANQIIGSPCGGRRCITFRGPSYNGAAGGQIGLTSWSSENPINGYPHVPFPDMSSQFAPFTSTVRVCYHGIRASGPAQVWVHFHPDTIGSQWAYWVENGVTLTSPDGWVILGNRQLVTYEPNLENTATINFNAPGGISADPDAWAMVCW